MHGITKRIAFLVELQRRGEMASARAVGESVEARHGEEYATPSSERNGILTALYQEDLVRCRPPHPEERTAKQQRFVYGLTKRGKREAIFHLDQANRLTAA